MLGAVYFSVLGVDNHTLWDFLDFLVWNVNISTFINSQVSFMRFYRRKRRPSIDCYSCTTTKLLPVPVGAGHFNETQNSEGLRFSTRTSRGGCHTVWLLVLQQQSHGTLLKVTAASVWSQNSALTFWMTFCCVELDPGCPVLCIFCFWTWWEACFYWI